MTQQEYVIQNGEKVIFQHGDKRPEAVYIYLGKRGGRYVISENKISRMIENWRTLTNEDKNKISTKLKKKTKELKIEDLWR
jgi:hypothetical protein